MGRRWRKLGVTSTMTDRVELLIDDLDGQGYGVGFCANDHRPIRVWGCTLGDRLIVRIIHRSPHRLVGQIDQVIEPGERHAAPCPHRPDCGGCPQWEANDKALTDWRVRELKSALPWLTVTPLAALPRKAWRTRSKWWVTRHNDAIRFEVPRPRSDKGLAIPECPILPPQSQNRLALLKEQLTASEFKSVHALVLTHGTATTTDMAPFGIGLIAAAPPPSSPPLVGQAGDAVAWLQQTQRSPQLFSGQVTHLSGPSCVAVEVGSNLLPTPPFAFVQAHPQGREQLLEQVLTWIEDIPVGRAVDLGSGTGFFARPLAKLGWQVNAIEPSPHAAPAWSDTPAGIQFHALGAEAYDWDEKVDLVIIDPPRRGMQKQWFAPLLAAKPRMIIAIHCGQAAAIRDLTTLRESGYNARSATLVDLFPGSPHGELMSFWELP